MAEPFCSKVESERAAMNKCYCAVLAELENEICRLRLAARWEAQVNRQMCGSALSLCQLRVFYHSIRFIRLAISCLLPDPVPLSVCIYPDTWYGKTSSYLWK